MVNPDALFDQLLKLKEGNRLPPVHLWQPERAGEIDIEIDANGVWRHEGREFQRHSLVKLFASILRLDGTQYFLVTPAEKLKIVVADVPFMAVDMEVKGSGTGTDLLFTTNVDDYVLADHEHPLLMAGEQPYVEVRGGLRARLTRSVFYRLVDCGLEEDDTLAVYSQGSRFELGSVH